MNPMLSLVLLAVVAGLSKAEEAMPVARQNELVARYCAVCHTDAARNGGLSLQHFDAASVDSSLAAMLLSKMRGGAFGAAGLPIPDKDTRTAWMSALASQSVGSQEWSVSRSNQDVVTASILREIPPGTATPEPSLYRLVVSCGGGTRQGSMQLSWSPSPRTGTLSVSADGNPATFVPVEGREKMGNGAAITTGPAAIMLKLKMPLDSLKVGDLFPGQTVTFSFASMSGATRDSLSACSF